MAILLITSLVLFCIAVINFAVILQNFVNRTNSRLDNLEEKKDGKA